MSGNRKYIFIGIIVLIAGAVYYTGIRHGMFSRWSNNHDRCSEDTTTDKVTLPSPPKDTLPMPASTQWLADSTHLFLIGDAYVTVAKKYPVQRELTLDGSIFFDVTESPQSLIIKTKLLDLSVSGKAALLVMAPAKEEWAEVQVLSGTVIAKKAYPSQFNEPDTLKANQIVMINRTIDLMEKEKLDATDLRAWRSRLP